MREIILYYVMSVVVGVGMCYAKANDMNRLCYHRRDDIFIPIYHGRYIEKRYYITKHEEGKYYTERDEYVQIRWKKLNSFFRYEKPFRRLRLRAYLIELFAQVIVLVGGILLLVGLVLLSFIPESIVIVKTVLVLYGLLAVGFVFLYDLGMNIYVDYVRAKKILNGDIDI